MNENENETVRGPEPADNMDQPLTQHQAADIIKKRLNRQRDQLISEAQTLENAVQLIQTTLGANTVTMLELLTYQNEYGPLTDELRAKHIDAVIAEMQKRGIPIQKRPANG